MGLSLSDKMFFFLELLVILASTHAVSFRNVCVQDDPKLTLYGLTFSACEEACGSIIACQNFIYTRRSFRCELYGSVSNLNACTGNVFVSTASNMLPGSGLQYCPNISEEKNTVVLGNMNAVGAKRAIGCLPQYALDGDISTQCLQNGTWLEHGSCVRVCTAPPHTTEHVYTEVKVVTSTGTKMIINPDTGTLQSLEYFVGSIVQVTCVDAASVIVDGPAQVTCLQDGAWSVVGICVKICSSPGHVQNLLYAKLISRDGQTVDYPDTATVESFLFASGSSVMVACSAGKLVGSATVNCQASGVWENFPICLLTTMRMSCSSSSDCVDTDSQCRNSQCWCNPGLSYSPSEAACVGQCQTYGNTFQDVPNHVIGGYDRASISTFATAAGCRDFCASDLTCNSVDYNYINTYCYVNTHLPFKITSFMQLSTWHYYQRDCA